jgi:hypothetical protein
MHFSEKDNGINYSEIFSKSYIEWSESHKMIANALKIKKICDKLSIDENLFESNYSNLIEHINDKVEIISIEQNKTRTNYSKYDNAEFNF